MKTQKGVALITVLLIVALATALVAGLYGLQADQFQQSRFNTLAHEAEQYGWGMERWGIYALNQDRINRPAGASAQYDSANEPWAQAAEPVTLERGQLSGRLSARDGGININNFALPDEGDDGELAELTLQRLRRLLQQLELESSLADAIADYVDADEERRATGAESLDYQGQQPPQAAANRPLLQLDELLAVRGIDRRRLEQLRPHLGLARPGAASNINFASAEVLRAVFDGMSAEQAERLAQNAEQRSLADLRRALPEELALSPQAFTGIDVRSSSFLAHSIVLLDGERFDFFSVLTETGARFHATQRSVGSP